ncbi:dihydroorotase [candidate division KSB1 bacterium]
MKTFNFSEIRKPLLMKNGLVWDKSVKDFKKKDLLIENGKFSRIGKVDDKSFNGNIIDLTGKNVLPGFFDMHVHLREPGREDKETIKTGSAAAFTGGFTGICSMPNTDPVCDNIEVVKYIKDKAKNLPVEVFPIGAVSKGLKGEEIAEFGDMVEGGIVGVSDDGNSVDSAELMRRALEYSKMFDIPVIVHEEDSRLSGAGVMNEGFYSTKLGLPGIPDISETAMIMRDIEILKYSGGKLHIAHLSVKDGVKLIKDAKDLGLKITAEVTPHHLTLTEKEIEKYDPNFKMKPPLRSEKDVQELKKGVIDGTIDAFATDHAPHTYDEKEEEFDKSPCGIIGLETAFSIILREFYFNKLLTMSEIIDRISLNPRKILNIPLPEIKAGSKTEITIVDLNKKWTVKKDDFYSKSQNSPYIGTEFKAKIVASINKNKIWSDI